ncbi:MAG TPA: MFS transporter [Steroidobacteraceae bacterium]|nr:MFS transporter [Steroidobacteraceae bacterium]
MKPATLAVGSMIAVMFMGSTIVTPLYSLYAKQFGFSPVVLTLIYAAYVIGNLVSLFFFGGVSDRAGRRRVVLWAMALAAVSTGIYLFATSTPWLVAARVLSGFSIGLGAGTGTAWIAELDAEDRTRATLVAVVSNFAGLGLGPLISGLLAQYSSRPLHLPFLIYIGVVAITAVFIARSPETVNNHSAPNTARRSVAVPRSIRARFIAPAITAFTVFSLYGFYFSLAPGVLIDSLHLSNRAIGGAVVFELGLVAAATIIVTRRLASGVCMRLALILLVPTLALLIAAQAEGSLPLLLLGTALSGISGALGYRGSLQVVNQIAPADQRAGVSSVYFIVCFIGNSLPVIAVAVLTRTFDSLVADSAFAVTLAVLALGALVLSTRMPAVRIP